MPRVRIQTAEALPGYRLRLGLSDGRTIERDFAAELAAPIGPMDAPLKDPQFFAQVRVDPELETVVWPNGYDMDPDVLIGLTGVEATAHVGRIGTVVEGPTPEDPADETPTSTSKKKHAKG